MPELFPDGKKVQSAIFPVILGKTERAVAASRTLSEQGFFVPAIRFPTVAKDSARLRVTLSARHSQDQITALCRSLRYLLSRDDQ
jgi:7-keto-8-aminopelargonate synthetase-like enzyme